MSSSSIADLLSRPSRRSGSRASTASSDPDFTAMARGIGIFAQQIEDPVELEGAMREEFAHSRPALLDAVSARQELSMPSEIGIEQATGFSVWVAKAVIDGRGSEVVDLARTNLLR